MGPPEAAVRGLSVAAASTVPVLERVSPVGYTRFTVRISTRKGAVSVTFRVSHRLRLSWPPPTVVTVWAMAGQEYRAPVS